MESGSSEPAEQRVKYSLVALVLMSPAWEGINIDHSQVRVMVGVEKIKSLLVVGRSK